MSFKGRSPPAGTAALPSAPAGRYVQSAAPQAGHRGRGRGGFPRTPAQLFCLCLCRLWGCFGLFYFFSFWVCVFFFFFSSPLFSLCVCLWPAGPPLRCSSASSTPPEQSPSPPPSPPANEGPGRLLGNGAAQPAADSDSEEEFVPNSFLVKSGSGNLCVAANGEWFSLYLLLLLVWQGVGCVWGGMCPLGWFWNFVWGKKKN